MEAIADGHRESERATPQVDLADTVMGERRRKRVTEARLAVLALGIRVHYARMEAGKGRTIYQHPLAYLLGLEGIALLHAFGGEYDREFTLARLAETRALLDMAETLGDGATAEPVPTEDGYRKWAPMYDSPGNQLIDIEQPIVQEILASLPVGVALDAACGRGRHAAYLATLGHRVIGVDSSAEMLAIARTKLPNAVFHDGDLHRLPVPDEHVDLVVCALALTHVPALAPVLAEFVRVLRPGGHLVRTPMCVACQRCATSATLLSAGMFQEFAGRDSTPNRPAW